MNTTPLPNSDNNFKTDLPKVLVLLATRNGAAWLEQQLASVVGQLDVSIDAYVRDDGSSDETRQIVTNFSAPGCRIMLRQDHHAVGSAGKNFFELILHSNVAPYDYVAFCDQDDEWDLDKMKRAIGALKASGADGYSSGVEAFWPDGRTKQLLQVTRIRFADHLFEGAGQGCTFVMTRSLFTELQAILTRNSELLGNLHYHDWTIYAIARTLGKHWFIDPVATMSYRQHSANDTGARGSFSGLKRRIVLIQSGWYRRQIDLVTDLISSIRPNDPAAAQWNALAMRQGDGPLARFRRLQFVLVKGRRRLADRLVLGVAVVFGYI